MDNFVDERDYAALNQDRYTFFVLRRIVGEEPKLLLTDHEKLMICFSKEPYPIWIWTAEHVSVEEMEKAYLLAKDHGFLEGGHSLNIKYELASYFIERAETEGIKLAISMNMFAYDCINPQKGAILFISEKSCNLSLL